MSYPYPDGLDDGMDLNETFSDKSLAAADSLALSPSNRVYIEHSLPGDEVIVNGKNKTRKRDTILAISALMITIIVVALAAVLTTSSKKAGNAIDGIQTSTNVEDSASNNYNASPYTEPLPDLYYLLESKVHNPSSLLNISTPEGKAFNRLVDESETKNIAATRSIPNDAIIERYALLVLYYGADGGAWTSNTGWETSNIPCEAWYGVTCRSSVVTGIDLDGNNLHGRIPDDFCLMSALRNLVLSGNQLEPPSCFSRLSNLEELDFRGNGAGGGLPSGLYSIPSLTYLELSENDFTGTMNEFFPNSTREVSIFPRLKSLNLANNLLSGTVPQNFLRRMTNLDTLILDGNPDLSGSLNEVCKGDAIRQIDANCSKIECKCCTSGTDCDLKV